MSTDACPLDIKSAKINPFSVMFLTFALSVQEKRFGLEEPRLKEFSWKQENMYLKQENMHLKQENRNLKQENRIDHQ